MGRPHYLALVCCLLTGAAAGSSDTRLDPKAPQGSVGGRIQFPVGVAPAMRICALSDTMQQCIDSPAGRTLSPIEHLPDGDSRVVARVQAPSDTPVAGHVEKIECVAAPCIEPLATLHIEGGREIATADLNGFYETRTDFPALPD
jgi:hypothetical protein